MEYAVQGKMIIAEEKKMGLCFFPRILPLRLRRKGYDLSMSGG
jgi:hypothetical protein